MAFTLSQCSRFYVGGMIPPVPIRGVFRSRWMALAWAGGICLMAADFAGGRHEGNTVDAANSSDTNAAQVSSALAEDE